MCASISSPVTSAATRQSQPMSGSTNILCVKLTLPFVTQVKIDASLSMLNEMGLPEHDASLQ